MKIVVIENREWVRQWISSMLSAYHPVVIHDSITALNYLSNNTAIPDVVILNDKLPEINGLKLIESINNIHSTNNISMVLLSENDTTRYMAQQTGIHAVLADNEFGLLLLPYTILMLAKRYEYIANSPLKSASMIC